MRRENYLIPGIGAYRAGWHPRATYLGLSAPEPQPAVGHRCGTPADWFRLSGCGVGQHQYVVYDGEVYVIEVNPRSSRTVPYISKVTGVPMVELATRAMLGEKLATMGYGTGLYPESDYVAVKVPVFSFEKLHDVDVHLGPEMKSTGEVLGVAKTFEEALLKGLVGAGYRLEHQGGVLITVRDLDSRDCPLPRPSRRWALTYTEPRARPTS